MFTPADIIHPFHPVTQRATQQDMSAADQGLWLQSAITFTPFHDLAMQPSFSCYPLLECSSHKDTEEGQTEIGETRIA